MDEHRLGALLLENPLMREEDLERCLQIQRLTGGRPLGQILVDEGLLGAEALEELLALQAARREASEPPAPVAADDVEALVQEAARAGAGELVLSSGRPAMVRIAGQLQPFTKEAVADALVHQFVEKYLGDDASGRLAAEGTLSTDFAHEGVARGRVVAFRHAAGVAAVVRLHPEPARPLTDAGMGPEIAHLLHEPQGLILVAGERRSGLSETLGALLAHAAEKRDRLVLVLDEELEYPALGGEALVVRRRVGEHTRDYASGLSNAISQDADVLVVGNASEPEVFDVCLRAAEAGRLVLAAVRARSVTSALERSLSFYPPRDLVRTRTTLAAVLKCVVAVHLLPDVRRRGQVMATESLVVDEVVREVLREGVLSQLELLMRLEGSGCGHTMDHSLLSLLRRGEVAFQDAFSRAEDKNMVLAVSRGEA